MGIKKHMAGDNVRRRQIPPLDGNFNVSGLCGDKRRCLDTRKSPSVVRMRKWLNGWRVNRKEERLSEVRRYASESLHVMVNSGIGGRLDNRRWRNVISVRKVALSKMQESFLIGGMKRARWKAKREKEDMVNIPNEVSERVMPWRVKKVWMARALRLAETWARTRRSSSLRARKRYSTSSGVEKNMETLLKSCMTPLNGNTLVDVLTPWVVYLKLRFILLKRKVTW